MKIAVLSDIHGNYAAFEAIIADVESWQPDLVVINGDIINRGPKNLECWQLARQKAHESGWHLLRGNHEEYILKLSRPEPPQTPFEADLRQFATWAYEQVEPHLLEIVTLPDRWSFTAPDGSLMMVMHGSYAGNRVGVYPQSEDEDLRKILAPQPALFVTAHTHKSLIRELDHTTIVNIGSAGLPFDEDTRPSYGRFTWTGSAGWKTELRRIEYDRAQAERDLIDSGFIPEAGPFSTLVMAELRLARGFLHRWHRAYDERCKAGELAFAEAVDRFIDDNDLNDLLSDVHHLTRFQHS